MSSKCTIFLAAIVLFSFACQNDRKSSPNVSEINADLKFKRFELDFYKDSSPNFDSLKSSYPLFWDIYFSTIMAEFSGQDSFLLEEVEALHQNEYLQTLLDSCLLQYQDLSFLEKELSQAIKYYRYYTGDRTPKTLVSFISEFGVGACTFGDDTLGVGVDMFLGSDFSGYDPAVFPAFIREQMHKEFMTAQIMKAFSQNLLPPLMQQRMIDIMINNGKILYLIDLFLPDVPDHIKMEYRQDQMEWVHENEVRIWNHFVSRELLYSTRKQDFQKLVGPSPNAPNMPTEAPGQTANFIGWQIIKSFVKKNPEISIMDMIAIDDAQKILEMSKYRPK
jgi:hypothetical protein